VGNAYHTLGDTRKGLGYFEQALEMNKELYGDQAHLDLVMSLSSVGASYYKLGETRKGLVYEEQALEMIRVLYGD
jgi:tetratricopeptide (TPR) repeat protein